MFMGGPIPPRLHEFRSIPILFRALIPSHDFLEVV